MIIVHVSSKKERIELLENLSNDGYRYLYPEIINDDFTSFILINEEDKSMAYIGTFIVSKLTQTNVVCYSNVNKFISKYKN